MKSRAVVSIALAAALGVSLSACNYFAPQRTTAEYAASDGVHVDAGAYQLRNLIVLAPEAEGGKGAESATLVGAVVNSEGKAGSLTLSYEGGQVEIQLPEGETFVPLSFGEGEQVQLTGAEFIPGQELDVTVTPKGQGGSAEIAVPILDGTLAEYSTLVPTQGAEPTSSPAATEPGATDPAATQPGETEPASTDPAATEGGADTGTGTGTP